MPPQHPPLSDTPRVLVVRTGARVSTLRGVMDVLTWTQLVELCGGRKRAELQLREGRWWRVVRGAYAPVELPDDSRTRAVALRLVLPSHAVPSHRTALWLLGLDVLGDRLDLTVPRVTWVSSAISS